TKLGRILRKTSLDEIPQLFNVLLGHMTFVGPRPIAEDEVEIYGPAIEKFKMVTPGVTGLWQTSGRSETSYKRRVELDMLYIEKRSILFDIWILLKTIPAVLLKRGAV
ncbi:MAG: sugar transferase, partial [Armatimonadota bacterium]